MQKKPVISAKDISIGYAKTRQRGKSCLHINLSFDLYEGELVCLLGANGAGKSTLLRTIGTSQPQLSGTIQLYEKNIETYSEKKLSKLLGVVLTDKISAGGLTVRELVEIGRYPYTGFFGQLDKYDQEIVEKAMSDVCILHKADCYVADLSDGERQKAMIAKALAQECPIILLDEPTAFLDIESCIEIITLLHYLTINQKKTILLSTHDINLALKLADRLWLLAKDEGLKCGVTEDIILSGGMDNFFKSESITFDKETGSFMPNRNSDKKVFIEASTLLYYWAKNMMERHGFETVKNNQDALFSLSVKSPHSIHVSLNDTNLSYPDFESLANWLKNNFL